MGVWEGGGLGWSIESGDRNKLMHRIVICTLCNVLVIEYNSIRLYVNVEPCEIDSNNLLFIYGINDLCNVLVNEYYSIR